MSFDEFFQAWNVVARYIGVFGIGIVVGIVVERWARTGKWSILP